MTVLSAAQENLFFIIKFLGAAYLLWLGLSVLIAGLGDTPRVHVKKSTYVASFSAGLIVTLSNPKAILFYVSLFPAYINLQHIAMLDAAYLYVIATL